MYKPTECSRGPVVRRKNAIALATAVMLLTGIPGFARAGPTACGKMAAVRFSHTLVTAARLIPANDEAKTPAYCELQGIISPARGSRIEVVYRLPERWNGKLLGLGGGGWAGNLRLEAAAPGLAKGYATAQTDGGHRSTALWDTTWAADPAAIEDFAHRAIHMMTLTGKASVAKYYGRAQSRAYFQGCSTGGRQALMEVQRYPQDYVGVVSGAPVYSLTTQTMALLRSETFARAGASVSALQLKHLNEAVLAACDAQDGLQDGIVTDPRTCTFDPAVLLCHAGGSGDGCLSTAQVQAVRAVYAGVTTADGEIASYPLSRGSELSWERFVSTGTPATGTALATTSVGAGLGGLRAAILGNAAFDLAQFDAERDYRTVRNSAFAKTYEAGNPDLSAFVRRGGKLLLWHGFDDPGPSPLGTIEYFGAVQRATVVKSGSLSSSVRLFIAPGVYHCRGGPGADQFDSLAALDTWVEEGRAPDRLIATRQDGLLSRPVCSYPALPRYRGEGSPDSAESFDCK